MRGAAGKAVHHGGQIGTDDGIDAEPAGFGDEEGTVIRLARTIAKRLGPGRPDNRGNRRRHQRKCMALAILLVPLFQPLRRGAEAIERDQHHRNMVGQQIGKFDAILAGPQRTASIPKIERRQPVSCQNLP